MDIFTKRHGYNLKEKEITIREDAPDGLRSFIIEVMYDLDYKPSTLRSIICKVLKVVADVQGNWSEYPNIDHEVRLNLLLRLPPQFKT